LKSLIKMLAISLITLFVGFATFANAQTTSTDDEVDISNLKLQVVNEASGYTHLMWSVIITNYDVEIVRVDCVLFDLTKAELTRVSKMVTIGQGQTVTVEVGSLIKSDIWLQVVYCRIEVVRNVKNAFGDFGEASGSRF